MRLLNLTVNNLGLFRGRHDFDLTPLRSPEGHRQNLIIIRGRNGVGKSTLFQSISLALHGSQCLGPQVSREEYKNFLIKRIHRTKINNLTAGDAASVTLSFEYVLSGKPLRIQVERSFERHGTNIIENLMLLCNSKSPDVDPSDYQTWLNDLVPPRLTALCFFDAERLDALSNKSVGTDSLNAILNRLLGLDLVERLQGDLEQYTIARGGGSKTLARLRASVIDSQTTVDHLAAQLKELELSDEDVKTKRRLIEVELAVLERRLASEGGAYAIRRPLQQQRVIALKLEIEDLEVQLREWSNELLPFAVATDLCLRLSNRLKHESTSRTHSAAEKLLRKAINELKVTLESAEFYRGLKIPVKDRKSLAARISRALKKSVPRHRRDKQPTVHNLSELESQKLQGWIARATEIVPQQVKLVGTRLHALLKEKQQAESDLKRAPEDSVLAPLYSAITGLQTNIQDLRRSETALSLEMGACQFKRDDATRLLQRAVDELHRAQSIQSQLSLAERSMASLRVYKSAMTKQRLAELENAVVFCFNAVSRKEHLLEAVRVSPNDYYLELQGTGGRILSLSELSAGERQLYGLALLWALRKVSGKQFPLAIDAPLARLDEVHRNKLLHEYIPAVSDQVLLFATDLEADEDLIEAAAPFIARSYSLNYLDESEQTEVTCATKVEDSELVPYNDESSNVDKDHKRSLAFDA